jgi:curli biogenesis system outer membrane secretion channel CsgG
MKPILAALLLAALAGCGLETAGTAATSAAIKKQELDQGKKTMEQAQQKLNESVQLQQQRAAESENQSK